MRTNTFKALLRMTGIGVFAVFLVSLTTAANAQCGGSFEAMADSAFAIQNKVKLEPTASLSTRTKLNSFWQGSADDDDNSAIVGLWHIKFNITVPGVPNPITIQEAFQIWNTGGTEVHNPKVDPRTGPVCLGAWATSRGVFKLAHRVWSYSPNGDFLGTINLSESVRVVDKGRQQTGSFTLDFFDPDGNPLATAEHPAHVEGAVAAERISPE